MRLILCENYEEMSNQAAKIVASQITLKPDSILGLATGSTPIGLYDNLIEMNKKGASYLGDITQWKRKKLRAKGVLKTAIEDFDIIRLNEIASNLIAQGKN